MPIPTGPQLLLIVLGSFAMFYITLTAIGRTAAVAASDQIAERRAQAEERRRADAAAEAAGRAAALEPLALNSDGSIEEPFVAEVEKLAA